MTYHPTLADLLDSHMKKAAVGDARLAKMVNTIAENNHFINRSTIRNWRDGSSKKANNPRQLVTIAVALRLDEIEANALLESGGCTSITALKAAGKEADQTLLSFWTQASAQEPIPNLESRVEIADTNTSKNTPRVWPSLRAGIFTLASVVAIFSVVPPEYFQLPFSSGNVSSPDVENKFVIPVIRPVKLGRQCLINLADQPTGTIWAHGKSPDCPELVIFHQYGEYTGDDLLPWNEGVAQCFVETNLERLWIAFDLPGGGEGWLRLTWFGRGASFFREEEPVTPTLWAAPEVGSTIVGRFGYKELAGKASKLLLDFPEKLDLSKAFENGDFHLGGCWQAADRDKYKGIHFYWPHNTPL